MFEVVAVLGVDLAGEQVDGGLVYLVQMRLGPRAGRHGEQMPFEPALSAEIPSK